MDTKKKLNAIVMCMGLFFIFQSPSTIHSDEIKVNGFTDEAVQEAVESASSGDIVVFPEGEYSFNNTVVINKSITLLGAAEFMNVGVVEPGEPNDPPYWDSSPSVCFTENIDLNLFHVNSNAVTIKNLKLAGSVTHEDGTGRGIRINGYNRLTVVNCEITRFLIGVDFTNSLQGIVTGCYLIENYRDGFGYGVSVTGITMASGGSEVVISENEFSFNRHSIASNSPETKFVVENNYFHDNDLSQWQACVDTHAQGGYTLRLVVRNNIFERTRPMAFKSGSLEITGNYFDPGCGDYSVGGYSRMIDFGGPTHNGEFVPEAILHNIYIGDNINDSDPLKRLIWVDDYDYSGETKFVAFNMFVDGRLFRYNSYLNPTPRHPFPGSSPNPFVGHMYVTLPSADQHVDTIESNTWYDLHVLAVDPEKAENIVEIGAQLVNSELITREAYDNINQGMFAVAGNYFIRSEGSYVYSREEDGSADWNDVTENEGMYVDGTKTTWAADGSHRIHFTARFRVSDQAVRGKWRLYGYARDNEGNLPIPAWHEFLEGWPIDVNSDVTTSVNTNVPQQGIKLDNNYPNPFNPVTTISFTLSERENITLSVYNIEGKLIKILFDEVKSAGSHSVKWDAAEHGSGLYLYRLTGSDGVSLMGKMMLVK